MRRFLPARQSVAKLLNMARRNHDVVSRHRLANRLRAKLGEVEEDRNQDDREDFAARKGNAGSDENGLQGGRDRDEL